MIRLMPKWVKSKEGEDRPICPYCNHDYGDGAIFDVKNYPDDGGAILFLGCEKCKEEAQINFDWSHLQKDGQDLIYIKQKEE